MTNSQITDFVIFAAWTSVVPFIFGLFIYRKMHVRERVFFYLLAANVFTTTVQYFTIGNNNLFTFYIYALFEITLIPIALFLPYINIKTRTLFFSIITVLLVATATEAFLIPDGLQKYNSISVTGIGIFIITLSIYAMIQLRKDDMIDNLVNQPFFWFALSMALFYAGSIVTTGFKKFIQDVSIDTLHQIVFIEQSIYLITVVTSCIGLWQIKKRPAFLSKN